jgi:hypothetical protein
VKIVVNVTKTAFTTATFLTFEQFGDELSLKRLFCSKRCSSTPLALLLQKQSPFWGFIHLVVCNFITAAATKSYLS